MSESRVRENRMHGLKRRGLETEQQPPRQSPTLLSARHRNLARCSRHAPVKAGTTAAPLADLPDPLRPASVPNSASNASYTPPVETCSATGPQHLRRSEQYELTPTATELTSRAADSVRWPNRLNPRPPLRRFCRPVACTVGRVGLEPTADGL